MKKEITLPFFGTVALADDQEEQQFCVTTEYGEQEVEFNLIFENDSTELKDLERLKIFLDDFENFAQIARHALLDNADSNAVIKEFISFHTDALEEEGKEMIMEMFGQNAKNIDDYFLNELNLAYVYLFPDDQNEYIKLNFQISEEFCEESLCVHFNMNFKIAEIIIEA